MGDAKGKQHLSQIETDWVDLFEAHGGVAGAAGEAQRRLLERYGNACYRFLLSLVRDRGVADDLFQEFALRLVRGSFVGIDPRRSRFRDYLKAALRHLATDHHRRQRRQARPLGESDPPAPAPSAAGEDEEFLKIWREELMARALRALAAVEGQTGQPLYTVLRLRMDHPEMHSPEMAERLAGQGGRPVTPGSVRKWLHLARQRLKGLLLEEVRRSLPDPTEEAVGQELMELGLLEHCRTALRQRPEDL
jgi:RNA polymerase sigma-70 factor (ECF subfamily)